MQNRRIALGLVALTAILSTVACDSSDVLELILPDVQGTWLYTADNPDEATFVNCNGDLSVLEGMTVSQARAGETLCTADGAIDVLQIDEIVTVNAQTLACSDGSTALISGFGTVDETTVSGQWQSISDEAVTTVQDFSGIVLNGVLHLEQDSLSVAGGQSGTCAINPPLAATVVVN